jgi:type I restriction enzyme S subunit
MGNLQSKKRITVAENQKLSELRDWLLPMLMNRQIKVGGIEKDLRMVARSKMEYKKVKFVK